MKHLLFFVFAILSVGSNAQSLKAKDLSKDKLAQFVNTISAYQSFPLKHNSVKVITTFNAPGSAGEEGTGTVSNNVYLSVCQDGEEAVCKLVVYENLINPKLVNVSEDDTNIVVQLSYGNAKERKTEKLLFPKEWNP
ncbi:hypothetical protein [Flavobacterium sedimenticola]|uniref:Uncharacterized protein n=1 Tax=Flavobacterium sedimenticola TaxID=3043286 RepID=A0ABT6XPT7_9FLAO|nr:hypothetical protein [Flavobacterium sedimenticola]MDI9257108.1 hypothetical protein [Flavobacterium sedimenticola]